MREIPLFPFVLSDVDEDDPVAMKLRDTAPVVRARTADGTEVWVALTYETARQAVSDPRLSRSAAFDPGAPRITPAQSTPDMLTSMDGDQHARVRRQLAKAFTTRLMEGIRPRIEEVVDGLLDEITPPADLLVQLAIPLPMKVICDLFGVPGHDRERFRTWAERIQATTSFTVAEILESVAALEQYGDELIALKREQPADDLVTELVRISDNGGELTESQIVQNLLLILVAAHDATLKQLSISLIGLLTRPDQYAWLCAHPEAVPNAVEELMRFLLLSPTGLPIRIATEDVDLGGELVREGEGVVPMHHVANRDPAVFECPNKLDLTRRNAVKHMSFGGGPHYCMGAGLARTIMQVVFGALTRRFPTLQLAVPPEDLTWQENGLMRAPKAIPVEW
ncbi:MAG TPA: cytochrome P450 [Rugosimonospora sp.]|nr:cytochrome P450 [Rugosimonospora sp.]